MIISAFRNYNIYNLVFLLLITLLLRIAIIVHSPGSQEGFFPLNLLSDPRVNVCLTALVIFSQAILLNRSITRHNLFSKTSYLPALMYAVLASMFSPFLTLNPVLICNFFLLWLIDRIFFLYRGANVLRITFDMGLAIGAGSLFYYPFFLIFPVTWFSLIIFRPFAWREWVSPVIGLVVPYIFAFTWFMYTDNMASFLEIWQPFIVNFPSVLTISPYDYIALVPLLFLLGLSVHKMWVTYFKNVVLIRKSQVSLALLSVLLVASFLLSAEKHLYHFMMLAVPFAVFLAYYFITAKVRWFYETLFALLLGSIFYFQFV
ncbi:hypothetical protein EDD80_11755 [Anseongella ginsenosidimutans]|uniref:Beta-carotene 15,15'-monooxygenase n=1 Tax=Anseongella ginsenosidimutans TaxID=496056 RepID=A0A4R3KM97_9SPHI|nr:hypothetical protein [Anseongella ginsenosidimutans]QEC52094.1 hypothetical protein FRZ59_06950 [Anseongella ginsenosidimutans]TCS84877.1 hypothetical protein EDD80_11755 [Anseongella ginsenosidimutans]